MEYFTNQSQWNIQSTSNSHSPPSENGQQPGQAHPPSSIDPATYNFGDLSVSTTPQPGSYNWFTPTYYPFTNQAEYNIPVTTYSSLNGATSISSSQSQVAIDPSLTSPTSHLQGSSNASNYPSYDQPSIQQEPVLSINPSVLTNLPSLSSPRQPTPTASTSRGTPKVAVRDVLKPLLTASKLSGPSAVGVIVRVLESYGYQDIDCDTRTDFFGKLSVQADDQFFKAWVENTTAMDITRTWLKAGAADQLDGPWRPSINPILSALGRMRFTLETLKNAKLGKIIVKLTKDPNSATRDLSQALEAKWRRLLESSTGSQGQSTESTDDKQVKKRKLSDSAGASKAGPPVKRPAVVAPARAVIKREPKVVVTSVKDAKSDSSFFSNKPKAKLPKFTKAAPAASKTSGGDVVMKPADNVAQPSSFDPFQDALRSMKRTASPKTEVRSGTPQADAKSPVPPTRMGSVRKRKSVTFAPDSQLEQIKWIEKAIYDDDLSIDTMHGMHTLRDLDRDEGAALHAHNLFEEQMDWTDVLLVDIPTTLAEKGEGSTEKVAQEEREKSALSAVYMFPSQIPDTPTEPPQPPPDDPDAECKAMMLGDEVDGLSNEQPASAANISELLASLPSQLPGLGFANPTGAASQAMGTPDVSVLSNFLHAMQNQGNLGALMQQFPPQSADASGWDSQQQQQSMFQNGNGNGWETSDTGWGGALGKGRGAHRGKRRLCNFFAQGRCRYGDSCDFSHDPSLAS